MSEFNQANPSAFGSNPLNQITKVQQAPKDTPANLIKSGKWLKKHIPGAISKLAEGETVYYSGDLILAQPLPDVSISHYLPASLLTQKQAERLNQIMSNEQDTKLRNKIKDLTFGASYSFQNELFSLAGICTLERSASSSLTAAEINTFLASAEWNRAHLSFAAANGISAKGVAGLDRLIKAIPKPATFPQAIWETGSARLAAILSTMPEESQNATAANILEAMLAAATSTPEELSFD